jgi:phosphatidylserine/phosphatidylglycerophosphate/cardiolipin synthase-like enzyme/uncharacterized membrane protein YdjX (TVP38/TMEM64 family)
VSHAQRIRYLVDGEQFFAAFRQAALRAEHSIFILGWDIHSRFELLREDPADGMPTRFGEFLDALARRRDGLDIYILTWDFAMILAPDREWVAQYKFDWQTHPRVRFRFDSQHATGGSHHQKVVVIDDRIACVGGLDFTRGRWDSSEHRPEDPRRADVAGEIPAPYHDVQMMVEGDVAADLGELARQRWLWATDERLPAAAHRPAAEGDADASPWPPEVPVDLADVSVGIARTYPAYESGDIKRDEVREVEQMLLDAIGQARRWIYIENQYFTAPSISDALAARLEEPDGPEVAIVLPRETVGWLSQNTMDVLRERRLRQLREVDRHDRLRVYYADLPALGEQCINVHSKVLVTDDDLLCVGSANLNNRSMGLDSECNLAVESAGKPELREGIALLRDRLLAEHLDVPARQVAETIAREGSLIRAIESLQSSGRTLATIEMQVSEERDAMVPETSIADPEQAIDTDYLAERFIPPEDKRSLGRGVVVLAALVLLALLLAAAWRWTPLGEWIDLRATLERVASLRGAWYAPLVVAAIYVIGGFLMFPLTVLIVATGLAFGAAYGFAYALLGAELSALASYVVGHHLGHAAINRLSGRWVERASRFLGRQGLLAMITLRIVPVAPFTVVNLVAGASHISFRNFALGTLLGLVPGTLALTVLSDQVVAALQTPGLGRVAVVAALILLVALGVWGLRRWLQGRQGARP